MKMQSITLRSSSSFRKALGFTIIELMITVAIVGLLAAVAYPSFLDQINKSRRATAAQSVLECAAILERRFTVNSTYTADACDELNNDSYGLTVVVTGQTRANRNCTTANGNQNCYLITATPDSAGDTDCTSMTFNEIGVKGATPTGNVEVCWRTS